MDSNKATDQRGVEKSKYLYGREISPYARALPILLPDDSLSALGYALGDAVTVLVGEVWQGDLAAVLTTEGVWHVGFLFFFEAGVRLSTSRVEIPPRYIFIDDIACGGRVVRRNGRAVIQAGITLPQGGVDCIRFRIIL